MPRLARRLSTVLFVAMSLLLGVSRDASHAAAQRTRDARPIVFTLRFVTTAALDDAWIARRIAIANALFAPWGVSFVRGPVDALPARFEALETRADRHALGAHLVSHGIDVFVVGTLRDVDAPGFRQGVHWRPRGLPGAHFVIVTRASHESTLTHELGHFFGNPHSDVQDNIMSYARSGPPFFDAVQGARIRQHVRRFLRTGELLPASRAVVEQARLR